MERQKQIDEAVKRMHKFGLMPKIVTEFENEGIVQYSEPSSLGGILFWVSNEPEWVKIIQDFEKKYQAVVYHVIHNHTFYGEILSFLYVSSEEDEWELDNEDLSEMRPLVYVKNLNYPEFSEFGSIRVMEKAGGLLRV